MEENFFYVLCYGDFLAKCVFWNFSKSRYVLHSLQVAIRNGKLLLQPYFERNCQMDCNCYSFTGLWPASLVQKCCYPQIAGGYGTPVLCFPLIAGGYSNEIGQTVKKKAKKRKLCNFPLVILGVLSSLLYKTLPYPLDDGCIWKFSISAFRKTSVCQNLSTFSQKAKRSKFSALCKFWKELVCRFFRNRFAFARNDPEWLRNLVGGKNKMPTAPCVPRRSPIQVLTGLNAA